MLTPFFQNGEQHLLDFCWGPEAQAAGCSETDIFYICIVDLNVPGAKSSERMAELVSLVQFNNDLCPQRNAALIELPEHAKKTSKRGLADEESELQGLLWSSRQVCDTRWVCPFDIHPAADAQTNRRPVILKFVFSWSLVNFVRVAPSVWQLVIGSFWLAGALQALFDRANCVQR